MTYDIETLKALLREADARYDANREEFEDSDCSDAMRAMGCWAMVTGWLENKLED